MTTENMLLLASASPRRSDLLKTAGIPFTVMPSRAKELSDAGLSVEELVTANAKSKATEVSERFPGRVVLGADTLVCIGNTVLGKPKDRADAKRMLQALSGKTHRVLTGFCLTDGKKTVCSYEETQIRFRQADESLIERYVQTGECDDKAGAYGIQGKGCLFAERIEGDYCNVVGLPICRVYRVLEENWSELLS